MATHNVSYLLTISEDIENFIGHDCNLMLDGASDEQFRNYSRVLKAYIDARNELKRDKDSLAKQLNYASSVNTVIQVARFSAVTCNDFDAVEKFNTKLDNRIKPKLKNALDDLEKLQAS